MYKFNLEINSVMELSTNARLPFLSINLVNRMINKSINLATPVLENQEQLDWFTTNEAAIKENICPVTLTGADSVAIAIDQFYDRANPEHSDELEKLFEYRSSHEIRFAFRGQDLPDILIAANSNGHEVSCAENELTYKYDVDIDSLFEEVERCKKELELLRTTKQSYKENR